MKLRYLILTTIFSSFFNLIFYVVFTRTRLFSEVLFLSGNFSAILGFLICWIFLILTIVKAYYITWDFMHMRDETFGLQASVVISLIFLIAYLAFILLVEGNYIYDVFFEGFVSWNF